MKILLYSSLFYPIIGGLESVVYTLAHEFAGQGHEVKVVTKTLRDQPDHFPFEVIRKPSFLQLIKLTKWSQVYFQACVTLTSVWPLLLIPRPLFITHQTWYRRMDGRIAWQDRLKLLLCRFANNISISKAIAEHIPAPSHIIPNPYLSDLFKELPGIPRNKKIVFLGRLVSDKGVDTLLQALIDLKNRNVPFTCTIIGTGPDRELLENMSAEYGLASQVDFIGPLTGEALVRVLNQHQLMVIPSKWKEPFGVVALEGIACGCIPIGSQGGGLIDAIGPCGVTFENSNVNELSEKLYYLLTNQDQWTVYRSHASAHLKRHTAAHISTAYLEIFEQKINSAKFIDQHVVSVSPQ